MACNCNYPEDVRAESVAVAAGTTTITLPSTTEIKAGDVLNIGLFTAIPDGTNGVPISITNGTVTGDLLVRNGNYFRPRPLLARTVFQVQYFSDPEHFMLLDVKGKTCRW